MIDKELKRQDSFIKNIYLNKIFFFCIFLLPKENAININKIKDSIKNIERVLSFEIIQREDVNQKENYIQSQNIKDKIKIQIFISNNEKKIDYAFNMFLDKNNYYFYLLTKKISLSDIIKNNFRTAIDLFMNDFYQTKKGFLPDAKENKEILSKNNIIKKLNMI